MTLPHFRPFRGEGADDRLRASDAEIPQRGGGRFPRLGIVDRDRLAKSLHELRGSGNPSQVGIERGLESIFRLVPVAHFPASQFTMNGHQLAPLTVPKAHLIFLQFLRHRGELVELAVRADEEKDEQGQFDYEEAEAGGDPEFEEAEAHKFTLSESPTDHQR